MPSKTKRTSGEKRSVEGEKKKKRNKADPTSVSDAEGAQDPEKDRPKGHKEDSSDHDGDAAIENTEDASSYDEKDDDEFSTSDGNDDALRNDFVRSNIDGRFASTPPGGSVDARLALASGVFL